VDGRLKKKEEVLPEAPAAEPLEDFLEE